MIGSLTSIVAEAVGVVVVGLITPIIAQAAGMEWGPLLNVGAVGAVLLWFMLRAEPRLRGIESAIDRSTRGNLILLLEIKRTTPEGRTAAETLKQEIEAAAKARGETLT